MIYLIEFFSHLKLCLTDAIPNFKRVKIVQILNDFEVLLIDATFFSMTCSEAGS